jgi:hypothetical protein
MVCTFLKVYMELGSYFLFLQEQIKDIIITSFRYQMVCAIYLEIIIPHLYLYVYDLAGSNDAYPQDANLTLGGKRYIFHEDIFSDLFCLV